MIQGPITKTRMEKWRYVSPDEEGLYKIAAPYESDCEELYLFRLNLNAGEEFTLNPESIALGPDGKFAHLELTVVLVSGSAEVSNDVFHEKMTKADSFYIAGSCETKIKAVTNCIFYIGGAIDEGFGKPYFRHIDLSLPIGELHQIHGTPGTAGAREVWMTCGPKDNASRLLSGVTWSGDGTWTSWPPHQHEVELEEAYCYFDMPKPHFGFHLSYENPGDIEEIAVHPVYSGIFVLAPAGYHPTVTSPGTRNAYVWIMAAHSHGTRDYYAAKEDPTRTKIKKVETAVSETLKE